LTKKASLVFYIQIFLCQKPIEREEKVFSAFKVAPHIEQQLPFKFKTKDAAKPKDFIDKQRVAIIREPKEAKMAAVMKMFKTVYNDRVQRKKEAYTEQVKKHKKQQEKIEVKRLQKSKELKKNIYRRLGQEEKKRNKHLDD
jgi:ribosome biogenesis protein BMS1